PSIAPKLASVHLPHGLDRAVFEAAKARIENRIVRTPILRLEPSIVPEGSTIERGVVIAPSTDDRLDRSLWLQLECTQITGSFKPRGALNRLLALPNDEAKRGIITASGGNHGLAVAYAGRSMRTSATIYLPETTPQDKAKRIARWGATVVRSGAVWD